MVVEVTSCLSQEFTNGNMRASLESVLFFVQVGMKPQSSELRARVALEQVNTNFNKVDHSLLKCSLQCLQQGVS